MDSEGNFARVSGQEGNGATEGNDCWGGGLWCVATLWNRFHRHGSDADHNTDFMRSIGRRGAGVRKNL